MDRGASWSRSRTRTGAPSTSRSNCSSSAASRAEWVSSTSARRPIASSPSSRKPIPSRCASRSSTSDRSFNPRPSPSSPASRARCASVFRSAEPSARLGGATHRARLPGQPFTATHATPLVKDRPRSLAPCRPAANRRHGSLAPRSGASCSHALLGLLELLLLLLLLDRELRFLDLLLLL